MLQTQARNAKRGGLPFGHRGTSRKSLDRLNTTIDLDLETSPYCGGAIERLDGVKGR